MKDTQSHEKIWLRNECHQRHTGGIHFNRMESPNVRAKPDFRDSEIGAKKPMSSIGRFPIQDKFVEQW